MFPILSQSYWRDEAFSVLLASKGLGDIVFLTIKDVHPPLYYFLLHFWIRLFGDVEYVTRSLSLLFLFLLFLSSFLLIKELLKSWKLSLMGSLAILLNPFLIEYAFEVRTYMMFAFLIVTATLFYIKRKYFIFSLFLTLAILTHNFGAFFLVALVAFWIYEQRKSLLDSWVNFSRAFVLPILFFLGWSVFLWNQWVKVAEGFWIGPQTSSIFIDAFRSFFQGTLDYPSRAMLYNLTVVLVILGLSYWVAKATHNKDKEFSRDESLILVFLFSIPFLIVYAISSFWVPIYHERFLIPVLPLFIIWIVYSLFKLGKMSSLLSYLTFALSLAYLLFAFQGSEEILRKMTKPAINYGVKQVLSQAGSGDVIIPEQSFNFLEIKYYAQKYRKDVPVYVYEPSGKFVFYIGTVLFEEKEKIYEYPKNKRIWIISPDGSYHLKEN